ncbi:MAG: CehA/McbA family metallohydrolase [Epulopiscium sp.]|nr:CehA/McbA family metallohydrolase [Candidatus Epulonipiscium sp.]
MKIKKYLSIAIGILEAMENRKHSHTADTVYETIIELEEVLKKKGFIYQEKSSRSITGTINLTVTNEENEGMITQVKFFPMKDTDTLKTFNKLDGRISFIRSYTKPDGSLSIQLPIEYGDSCKYFMEISKGSEYEILNAEVDIKAGEIITNQQMLSRIVNIQERGWNAGDIHHHSIYSSPTYGGTDDVIESPLEVAHSMQSVGLTYGALSDHHNILNHSEWLKTASKDFTPIISKEISTSNGHVMSLNVPVDVIYDIPKGKQRTEEFLRNEFIRITDEIHTFNGLAQINHPKDLSPAISLNPKFMDMIEIFDTMEIWNGSNPMLRGTTNYAAVLLWLDLLEEGRFIPATTGSDTHNIRANDYNKMLDKITWLVTTAKSIVSVLPSELKSEVTYLICLYDKTVSLLENWAENSLGSGCVRTYVYLDKECLPENILSSLRKGNSFLTNGPILIPSIKNKIPGEMVEVGHHQIDIDIKLISNKPLENLYIYTNGKKLTIIPLENKINKDSKIFNYSQKLKDFNIEDIEWILFSAASDCTNLAITNPIFIQHK